MMKTSHVMVICLGVAAIALTWGNGKSKEKTWSVDGGSLALVSPCAQTVTVAPSPDLSGKVEISATARRQSEIDQLDIGGGAVASIGVREHKCKTGGPHLSLSLFKVGLQTGPSLALTVKVPAGMPIDIREARSTDYEIGAVAGTLALDLSGSGDVSAEDVKDPVVHLSGSGSAQLDKASGTLEGRLSGSGDLSIDRADLTRTDLKVTGSGDVDIDEGEVGEVSVASSGNGDVRLDAAAHDADLSLSGSGDIHLREASGEVKRSRHGNGAIEIGDH